MAAPSSVAYRRRQRPGCFEFNVPHPDGTALARNLFETFEGKSSQNSTHGNFFFFFSGLQLLWLASLEIVECETSCGTRMAAGGRAHLHKINPRVIPMELNAATIQT